METESMRFNASALPDRNQKAFAKKQRRLKSGYFRKIRNPPKAKWIAK
jgi:hypothetical protein